MERLQKVLAQAGVGSRRQCELMISAGQVKVNGRQVKKLPVLVDPENDFTFFEYRTNVTIANNPKSMIKKIG